MSLSKMIDDSIRCNAKLIAAIRDGADRETIRILDQRLLFLLNAIRDLHVFTLDDINRQFKFFLHRSEDLDDGSISSFDRDALDCLVDRCTGVKKVGSSEVQPAEIVTARATIRLNNHRFRSDELVNHPDSRIALFNADYHYVYTSVANAKFHNTVPEEIVGKHMAEVVGHQRFEHRAKHYFDNCFCGEPQKYCYFLEMPNQGEHLMNCQVTPYRDGDGAVRGALVVIEDLSEKLQAAAQSAAQNLVA